ncbi:MAG: hypothetical protein AzoDbin1_01503 [Azoarcus sp.]|uniref:Uncharacterized protein n=1 Tax=Aromatoleum tolulyticum TaxID=34027 RepID=A0A1N7BJX4_9RHOO|nr:hypothetical protein [Azoarcus sp.]SIR51493.1 hypothetical protein SAMN05421829_11822 [Aromatoleum tolulyticum]
MAQLGVAGQDDGNQLIPPRFQHRIGIDIQDAHGPPEFGSQGQQPVNEIVTQMTPFATHDGELAYHAQSPALRVT